MGMVDTLLVSTAGPVFCTQSNREALCIVERSELISEITEQVLNIFEGGPGSGHWGHKGRKGKKGGSVSGGPAGKLPAEYEKVTRAQKIQQAKYSDISSQMAKNLGEIKGRKPVMRSVKGKVSKENVEIIGSNMRKELSAYRSYLAGDTMDLMHQYINCTEKTLGDHVGEFAGVSAKDMNAMCVDSVRKLIHQEMESNRQQFTDHGIRHIVKNTLTQKKMMDVLSDQGIRISGRERLMGNFIMVNHDVGYTVPLVREGGLRGVLASKDHPLYSMKIAADQRNMWNVGKIFSRQEYQRALNIIRTHDATNLDISDSLALTTRLSDNLSLFHQEKLPSMFQYIAGGRSILSGMAVAAAKKDTARFDVLRNNLHKKIDKANISAPLRRDLKAAVKEISYLTPKFTVGVLAGEVESIGHSANSMIVVNMKFNKYDKFLQKMFDMGQKQARKFLEDYGVKDFTKKKYTLGVHGRKSIVELNVLGVGK